MRLFGGGGGEEAKKSGGSRPSSINPQETLDKLKCCTSIRNLTLQGNLGSNRQERKVFGDKSAEGN